MTTHVHSTDAPRKLKSVLFCPKCAYESPLADNWLEVTTSRERVIVCPACGTIVDRRARQAPRAAAEAD